MLRFSSSVVAAMAAWVVAPRLATARRVRLDVVGTAVLCASVVASLYPLLFARDAGWPWWMLALLCVGLIGFVCFWKVEARLGARRGQPLVDVASLRERAFATGLAATFALYLGITSFLLVLTLYLQSGLRMSALRAGLTLAPLAVGFLVSSRRATHWTERRGIGVLIAGVGRTDHGAAAIGRAGDRARRDGVLLGVIRRVRLRAVGELRDHDRRCVGQHRPAATPSPRALKGKAKGSAPLAALA